ncbi:MAG: DNA repair protein RecN [Treponema sp.]|uniref:DNA repair protein RecN n=1 Tax=Treponema sp. TaxID=166 RepID=UPI0025E6D5CF|nr:DNA repair protein RecN [Treponema sp.]MBQ8679006.1 DNA repair protein RecN [Treponema sp.]
MLEDLSIKDFALIDQAFLEFGEGFTVLSGETGAGKSLLIGALSFLLGGKAGVEQIRTGAHESVVSGTFFLGKTPQTVRELSPEEEPSNAFEWLNLHGIEAEDSRVLLRRVIRENGKSGAWIGSTPVTRSDLAEFSSFLIDIHGQHEHQSLMKVSEHRKFLDSYAALTERVAEFTSLYSELVAKRKLLDELNSDDRDRAQKIDFLTFAVKEIGEAKLKPNEDIELDEEEKKLSSFEKLYSDVEQLNSALSGGEGEAVVSMLKKLRVIADSAASSDKSLQKLSERLDSAFYELSDIADEYKSYEQGLVFDPARLAEVQERQTLIYNLKKKYASSVSAPLAEVISYCEKAQSRLEELDGSSNKKDALEKEIAELGKKVYVEAKKISEARKAAAQKMSAGVVSVLSALGMNGTRFSVQVAEKSGTDVTQKCGPYGIDDIEFLISANPGQPLQPLAKIASGGELSRVMLSLKTILCQSDSTGESTVGTMIFDEIDTGIGGEVAVSIGSHLKKLAKNRQVLCITHLASIAVYADNQVKIEKAVSDGMTQTHVHGISGEERVSEIARMLSGDTASAESLEHARSMLAKFGGIN